MPQDNSTIMFRALAYHDGEIVFRHDWHKTQQEAQDYISHFYWLSGTKLATAKCHVYADGEIDEDAPVFFAE
jgi:hypothetical protein